MVQALPKAPPSGHILFKVVVGDWSDDGHGKCDKYTFECNAAIEDVQEAYLKAVKVSKVALHDDQKTKGVTCICCEYEDSKIQETEIEALKAMGVKFDFLEVKPRKNEDSYDLSAKDVATLFVEMAKTQLGQHFEYKLIEDPIPTINGYWKKGFNLNFGYGCYH